MKLFMQILKGNNEDKKIHRKSFAEYQNDLLLRQGREQFKKLLKQGLHVPVAYL